MMYASHGSIEFNARLDGALKDLAAEVRDLLGRRLVALILGGGYGRGEGAVVRRDGIEQPYNDVDLTLVVRRRRDLDASTRERLQGLQDRYGNALGVHVDFSRPLTVKDIENWPGWLVWQDLLAHHVTLQGPRDLLTLHAPPTLTAPLHPIEGTRLLLNRGAGLLWATRVLGGLEDEPDHDFVRRNVYKCALALGDALLIAHDTFSNLYRGRDELLRRLLAAQPEIPRVLETYERALRFKFCPDDVPTAPPGLAEVRELAAKWGEVWLHVENRRAGGPRWPTLETYAADREIREPHEHAPRKWVRNLAQNLRLGRLSVRYPRERLFRQLPTLLVEPRDRGQWALDSAAFLRLWKRFNA